MKTSAVRKLRNQLLVLVSLALAGQAIAAAASGPILRVECGAERSEIGVLSWDTEGGNRAQTNLLRESTARVAGARGGPMEIGRGFPRETHRT